MSIQIITPKKKRKTRILKKAEKTALVERLKAAAAGDCEEVVSAIIKSMEGENHIHINVDDSDKELAQIQRQWLDFCKGKAP